MNNNIKKYLALKVIADFRNAQTIEEDLCRQLNTFEYIDYIRTEVKPEDACWIQEQLAKAEGAVFEFAINLTWQLLPNTNIETALINHWVEGRKSINIVYALLNIEGLDIKFHKEIFEEIKTNWDFYVSQETLYAGGADMSLDVARKRLAQGNLKPSKEWIYWFTAACSNDGNKVQEFLKSIDPSHPDLSTEMNDFRKEVKEFLFVNISS